MRTCTVCGKDLCRKNTSGLCKPHYMAAWNSDPVAKAKRLVGTRRYAASPEGKLANSIRAKAAATTYLSTPEGMAAAVANMRRLQPLSYTPEALARRDNVTMAKKVSDYKMAWCPPEYREMHRHLSQTKRILIAECKAIIAEQIKIDRARMSPFERQEADLKAKLERNDAAPIASNDMFRRRAA